MLKKIISGLLGGFIVAVLGLMLVTVLDVSEHEPRGRTGIFFVLWVLSIIIAFLSKTSAKAWRHLMFLSASISFALTLSTIIFNREPETKALASNDEHVLGTVFMDISDLLFVEFMSIWGLLLGLFCLIVGLLVGREKQT